MVKTLKRHFRLETGEYIITPGHPMAIDIKVTHKGKELKNVTAIVFNKLMEVKR